jgi:hypothetical protein
MMKVPDHLYVLGDICLRRHIYVTRIAAMHIIFTHIGCTLFTCDMYMCRLRHINDSVLSSLKMEGIRLLLFIVSRHEMCGACSRTPPLPAPRHAYITRVAVNASGVTSVLRVTRPCQGHMKK